MLYPRKTGCDFFVMVKIALNDMSEWVLVEFIVEHNHSLSTTPSKLRKQCWHSSANRTNDVHSLVRDLNSKGIARVCNATTGCIAYSCYI